jgi:hypothetical protein
MKNVYETIEKLIPEVEKIMDESNKRLSVTDIKINHAYHVLEYKNLNAVQLAKLVKYLKNMLKQRRVLKDQIAQYQSSLDSMRNFVAAKKKCDFEVEKRNKRYMEESMVSYQNLVNEGVL